MVHFDLLFVFLEKICYTDENKSFKDCSVKQARSIS